VNVLPLLALAVLGSIYFSALETAYTSYDRIVTMGWVRRRVFGARTARFLAAVPERFLGTTLIGNNVCNVAYSSLMVLLAESAGIPRVWLITVSPLLILVFAEVLPKMLGHSLANLVVRYGSFPLLASYALFTPLRLLLHPLARLVARRELPQEEAMSGESFSMRRELDQILVGAEEEGAATPEEGEILSRYLDARDLKARQIMTPRTEMVALSVETSPDEVRTVFRKCRHNILPVYERDLDHVIGFVHVHDFLQPRRSLREVLRPIHAVPDSKRVADLLKEFKSVHRQVALVIDEYGGTDGLVTIKDIFEELVGPVAERFDPATPLVKRLAPGKFLVSGSAFLDDISAKTGWTAPEGNYNTLSGLLSSHLGRIPELGEDIVFDKVVVRVLRRSPRRVEGCLVKVPTGQETGQGTGLTK
jgi:putative hemolysin